MAANREHINNILGGDAFQAAEQAMTELQRGEAPPDPQQTATQETPDYGLDRGNFQQADPQQQEPQAPQRQQQQPPMPQQTEQEAGGFVPSGRLRQESEARRLAEERATRLEQRFDQFMSSYNQAQQQQLERTQAQADPDPNDDLLGYVQARERRFEDALKQRDQEIDRLKRGGEERDLVNQIRARAASDAAAYANQAPDFQQAYTWLRQQQMQELVGFGATQEEAAAHLDQQELQFTAHRLRRNQNAAEGFYNMARARGWKGAGVDMGNGQTVLPPDQGYQRQAQQPGLQPNFAPPAPVHARPIDQVAQHRAENMSLDQAPQGGTATPRSLDDYANMSDAEFMSHAPQVATMMAQLMR